MRNPEITILIPAYNEAARIPDTLSAIQVFLKSRPEPCEVILITDGSTDETATIAEESARKGALPIRVLANPINHGKGFCVAQGVQLARGAHILMTDADLSTPLEELDRLTPWLDRGYAVAIGSRLLREEGTRVERSLRRAMVGRVFGLLTSRLVLSGFRDTQCGFKLFEAEAARAIFRRLTIHRFAFDVEVLVIAEALGFRIAEVPISWREDPRSKVRLFRDAFCMVRDLIRIRRKLKNGIYHHSSKGVLAA